jgi:hypothetical protein
MVLRPKHVPSPVMVKSDRYSGYERSVNYQSIQTLSELTLLPFHTHSDHHQTDRVHVWWRQTHPSRSLRFPVHHRNILTRLDHSYIGPQELCVLLSSLSRFSTLTGDDLLQSSQGSQHRMVLWKPVFLF